MQTRVKQRFLILDMDIECRPLSWYGGDYVTKEVTGIACKYIGAPESEAACWLLGEVTPEEMFSSFLEYYNNAGMVTGHFIRGYDLPTLNGALTEIGFNPLSAKLTQDTKLDLIKRSGMSGSQENLSAMLGLEHEKIGMTQKDWRDANRLTPEGLEKTKRRVVGDILQHEELRDRLLKLRMLSPPKLWSSIGLNKPVYFD